MRIFIALLVAFQVFNSAAQVRDLLRVQRSAVSFVSEAPLERITAANEGVKGLLDRSARTFAVQVPIAAFAGFNAPLQREHFSENYLVSSTWPNATFTGRIIETVDLLQPGIHTVRAKGTLSIRGTPQERIIPCTVEVSAEAIRVRSSFDVLLADHGIRIPRVVQQKIAALVRVELDLFFVPDAMKP